MSHPLADADFRELGGVFPPERLSRGASVLDLHSRDESFHEPRRAEAVAWPVDAGEVSRALAWAFERGIAITPWGAGTGV
ncbi:MAG: FAD-binding oxidoreductase, partial [Proteobacteria bacterium]|nr:FAD-binding oxidoreductase [Pseudomonadota bacterium]